VQQVAFFLKYDKQGNPAVYKRVGKGKAVKAPEIKPSSTAFPSNHILMVRAGLENQWEPTCEELDAIAGLFLQALDNPGSVVVVRNGIEAWWIEQPAAKKTMIQSKGKK
jgi:hypothetical protein